MRSSSRPLGFSLIALAIALVSTPARAADNPLEWQQPSLKARLSFADDAPMVFVSRSQNATEWEKLPSFWNEVMEPGLDPATGKSTLRKVVKIRIPVGLNAPPVPVENPPTLAKWILGKRLYYDPVLSSDGTVSCASCHSPAKGYTDQAKVSTGIGGQHGGVSAPTVINSGYNLLQFWDGRAASLEDQAQGPVQNPIEMFDGKGHPWNLAVERVRAKGDYSPLFLKAFGTPPTRDAIAKAIATYERTVISGGSVNDHAEVAMKARIDEDGGKPEVNAKDFAKVLTDLIKAKDQPRLAALGITDAAAVPEIAGKLARGRVLFFNKARCNSCHIGENFTDNVFHNLGVGVKEGKLPADGWGRFTRLPTGHKNADLIGAFKTPTLRDLKATGPYMHDGSEDSLEKVVDFYDRGGNANEFLDSKMRDFDAEKKFDPSREGKGIATFGTDQIPIVPLKLNLTPEEKRDLVAFLLALQGEARPALIDDPKVLPAFPGK